jgi:hypothetical protein
MLESIPARVWGRLIVFVGACIAVVVIGQLYGSELTACGSNSSSFAQHRQWPVAAAGWVLVIGLIVALGRVLVSLIIAIVRDLWVDYVFRPLVWLGLAFFGGGGVGWIIIKRFGWTC